MNLDDALHHVAQGRAVLFVGAGLSTAASNLGGKPIPTANQLRDVLADEVGLSKDVPLDVMADAYTHAKGSPALLQLLRSNFSTHGTSQSHKEIVRLPWHRIYTTNYDDAIEFSLKAQKIQPTSFVRSEFPSSLPENSVVHLRGFISQLTARNLAEELVLSLSQQLASDIFSTSWAALLRQDFRNASSIIFVGYSFSDLDISRVLVADPDNAEKTIFLVEQDPHPAVELRLRQFGHLQAIGIDEFARRATEAASKNTSGAREPILTNFERYTLRSNHVPQMPNASQTRDLLVKGGYDDTLFLDAIAHPDKSPLIFRNELGQAKREAEDVSSLLVVHSDMGNGKTIFCDHLSFELEKAGFKTYWYTPNSNAVLEDVTYLKALGDKTAVFFEDIFTSLDEASYLASNCPNVKIIGSIRTSTLELRHDQIRAVVKRNLREIDLNRLSEDELDQFLRILTDYGFLGPLVEKTFRGRQAFIRENCNGELGTSLLYILKSDTIFSKLRQLYAAGFQTDKQMLKVLCSVCILAHAGTAPNLRLVSEFVGFDAFAALRDHKNDEVAEFLPFHHGQLMVRSPVLCQLILRELIPNTFVIEALIGFLRSLHTKINFSEYYRRLYHRMLTFGFIEPLFTDADKRRKLTRFYEEVRQLGYEKENPQFWMQYAIAHMSFQDYSTAETYFNTAYGLVEKKGHYNTYQIDNHYARFLLESRTRSDHWEDYFAALEEAHGLLRKQMADVAEGYYPYRMARRYFDLIQRRAEFFDDPELTAARNFCLDVREQATSRSDVLKRYGRQINDCLKAMAAAVDFIDRLREKRDRRR